MTARDRYRRCQAYARASKRSGSFLLHRLGRAGQADPHREVNRLAQGILNTREAHAWARLPDTARAAISTPSP